MSKIMMYDTPIAGSVSAAYQAYDNTDSGLTATNVQGAIDEIVSEKTDNTNLGTVELTTTATAAHAVGTYFILGGQFVKTTVAIGVGDTITVGTNVEATNVGSVLTELNSKTIKSALYSYTISLEANSATNSIHTVDISSLGASSIEDINAYIINGGYSADFTDSIRIKSYNTQQVQVQTIASYTQSYNVAVRVLYKK